jgi:hypothetical protein
MRLRIRDCVHDDVAVDSAVLEGQEHPFDLQPHAQPLGQLLHVRVALLVRPRIGAILRSLGSSTAALSFRCRWPLLALNEQSRRQATPGVQLIARPESCSDLGRAYLHRRARR